MIQVFQSCSIGAGTVGSLGDSPVGLFHQCQSMHQVWFRGKGTNLHREVRMLKTALTGDRFGYLFLFSI